MPWTVTPSRRINAENHHLIIINVSALSQKTWRKISLFLGDTGLSQAGSLLPLSMLGTKPREQIPGGVKESFPKAGVCGERVVIFLLCPQPGVIGRVPGAGLHPMTPEGGCRDDMVVTHHRVARAPSPLCENSQSSTAPAPTAENEGHWKRFPNKCIQLNAPAEPEDASQTLSQGQNPAHMMVEEAVGKAGGQLCTGCLRH